MRQLPLLHIPIQGNYCLEYHLAGYNGTSPARLHVCSAGPDVWVQRFSHIWQRLDSLSWRILMQHVCCIFVIPRTIVLCLIP